MDDAGSQGKRCLRSGVSRFVGEKPGKLGMFNHHSGIALDGGEVALLEGVAGFGGREHFAGEHDGTVSVVGRNRHFGGQSFVKPHDKFGNVVKPGKLLVIDHQAEQLAGGDVAVGAFVVAALHIQQRLVQPEKSEAQSDQLLAGGILGAAVVGGIRIERVHSCREMCRDNFIVRQDAVDFQINARANAA
jgi:hypothetical protein